MSSRPERAKDVIESLGVKREFPRFKETLTVFLRRNSADDTLLEERTVTENIGLGGALVLTTFAVMEDEVLDLEEIGGSFRARTRVIGVAVGDDGITRLNLRFLGDRAADRARDLLRRLGHLGTGHVTFEAEILSTGPPPEAIEDALRRALEGAPGDWKVQIAWERTFSRPWLVISFEGLGEMFRLSFRPPEQNPQFIHDCVRRALGRRKLIG